MIDQKGLKDDDLIILVIGMLKQINLHVVALCLLVGVFSSDAFAQVDADSCRVPLRCDELVVETQGGVGQEKIDLGSEVQVESGELSMIVESGDSDKNLIIQQDMAVSARNLLKLTWYQILLGFIGTSLLGWTLWETRRVANFTSAIGRGELRPVLALSDHTVHVLERSAQRVSENVQPITVAAKLTNTGRSAAQRIRGRTGVAFLSGTECSNVECDILRRAEFTDWKILANSLRAGGDIRLSNFMFPEFIARKDYEYDFDDRFL